MSTAGAPAELRRAFLVALLPLALLWFGGLEYRGLFQPDEGRYAEISREMLVSGDWITPRLNDLKYFEKPPLQYWGTALALAAFGPDEWSARLWPAGIGFLCIFILVLAGNRTGPHGAGYAAGLVLTSCIGFFVSGQYLSLDMGLTVTLCATLCAFLLAQANAAASHPWMLLAWAAMGCAVMSKGLVGLVLPALALLAYAGVQRDWALLRRLEWSRGLALLALIVLPWHVLVQWRNPEFFHVYVIHEHFERYLLPEHHRPGPWWYFLLILTIAMIPWVVAVPGAVRRAFAARLAPRAFDADRFLAIWSVVILVFFSASKSKLPGYIVPAIPALALLIGRDFARRAILTRGAGLALALAGAALLAFGVPLLTRLHVVDRAIYGYLPWFLAGAAIFVAGGLLAWVPRVATTARLLVLAFASMAGAQAFLSGMHRLDAYYSTEEFAEQLLGEGSEFAPEPPFYSVGFFDNSLAFYLGRTMTLVAYRGELGSGIDAEPSKYVASLEEFKRQWVAAPEAYAAMLPQQYADLRAQGLPMRVLAIDAMRVIVSRDQSDPPVRPKRPGWILAAPPW